MADKVFLEENGVIWNDADFVCEYLLAQKMEKTNLLFVEYPNSDSTTRRLLREKIAKKLPFEFQKESQFEKS